MLILPNREMTESLHKIIEFHDEHVKVQDKTYLQTAMIWTLILRSQRMHVSQDVQRLCQNKCLLNNITLFNHNRKGSRQLYLYFKMLGLLRNHGNLFC